MSNFDASIDVSIYEETCHPHGGVARAYCEILPRMCDQEPALHMYLWGRSPYTDLLPKHAHIYKSFSVTRNFRPARLRNLIGSPVNHVLASVQLKADMLWHSINYALPPRKHRAIITSVYDLIWRRFPQPTDAKIRMMQERAVLAADIIICNSRTTAADVQETWHIPTERIYFNSRAPSTAFKRNDEPDPHASPTAKPFLLYVGARLRHKNFDGLLDAYVSWRHRADIDLVVVGDHPWTPREAQFLVDNNLLDSLHLLLGIDDNALSQLYNQAVALVYPSHWEGFGIPLLESMACGCPIIASKIPSTVEIAENIPIYFELNQLESFHQAFELALSEGGISSRTQNGLVHVKQFTWDHSARQTLAAYKVLT